MPRRRKPGGGHVSVSRDQTVTLHRGKGRKASSRRWLERQLNDPYVSEARRRGYRSRAAFKLIELDEKFGLLRKGHRIVDLGAAPGGWTQIALEGVGPSGKVVAIDLSPVDPIGGAIILEGDMRDAATLVRLSDALGGKADIVLSDMAAPATGHAPTDHLRIIGLAEAALNFAEDALAPGGIFVAKVLQGGTERELLDRLKRGFKRVAHAKPEASRKESAEMYVVAIGFRGGEKEG
ncbi:MAG: Ribosomal RNA large subunit methyltransferase E [Alphaproteobacteria bacterium MarineAlpha10_Bin3]|jgi:23S rRNA (uridine2552-2'-O)-methyltransferase|nr:MAG: Ribosomal RNA large subunit methyltransferase E [Alphaproteobacteria bacterium MarineAlpha10_Bin3]PPR68299.1 MAG: Ribosomal RNA large subunit methyltransferase E [Alphaproteobacteria bacterium MarineAlpha4_Bin1]